MSEQDKMSDKEKRRREKTEKKANELAAKIQQLQDEKVRVDAKIAHLNGVRDKLVASLSG